VALTPRSDAYSNGSCAAAVLGGARLAYAGLAKAGAAAAESGVAASAFRSNLGTWRGGGNSLKPPNLSQYETDAALQAAAGRTNFPASAWGQVRRPQVQAGEANVVARIKGSALST
jgi:hypothetical protein